jgi:hypothetical protein
VPGGQPAPSIPGGGGGHGTALPRSGGGGGGHHGKDGDEDVEIEFVHEHHGAQPHASAPHVGAAPHVAPAPAAHGSVAIDAHSVRQTAGHMRSSAAELRHTTHRLHPHSVLTSFPTESRLAIEVLLNDLLANLVIIVEELEQEAIDLDARASLAEAEGLDDGAGGGASTYRGGFES